MADLQCEEGACTVQHVAFEGEGDTDGVSGDCLRSEALILFRGVVTHGVGSGEVGVGWQWGWESGGVQINWMFGVCT